MKTAAVFLLISVLFAAQATGDEERELRSEISLLNLLNGLYLTEDQLEDLKEQGEFEGPLVNHEEKGNTVELVGTEEVEGTPAYKLKVTEADGDVTYMYLDQEYYIEFKTEARREVQGTEVEFATVLGDYKEVDGLMIAHSMEASIGGMPAAQVITLDKIELGVEIPDERFAPPTSGD